MHGFPPAIFLGPPIKNFSCKLSWTLEINSDLLPWYRVQQKLLYQNLRSLQVRLHLRPSVKHGFQNRNHFLQLRTKTVKKKTFKNGNKW